MLGRGRDLRLPAIVIAAQFPAERIARGGRGTARAIAVTAFSSWVAQCVRHGIRALAQTRQCVSLRAAGLFEIAAPQCVFGAAHRVLRICEGVGRRNACFLGGLARRLQLFADGGLRLREPLAGHVLAARTAFLLLFAFALGLLLARLIGHGALRIHGFLKRFQRLIAIVLLRQSIAIFLLRDLVAMPPVP